MKVFDYLCEELSLALNTPVIGKVRYDLWISMSVQDAHPLYLTPDQAKVYLESGTGSVIEMARSRISPREWDSLLSRVGRFDPEAERPEDVFRRLGQ